MNGQMLAAAREAAWAAQSAAEAAWWALIPNAVAAVGTVGALIFAVVAANSSARAQQQRQAATLIGLSHAFGTASRLIASSLELSKTVPLNVAIKSVLATGGLQTQLEIVRSVRLTEFPSVRVLAQFNGGHASLSTLIDDMQLSVVEGGMRLTTLPRELGDGAAKLAKTADELDSEARRLVWPWPIS